jgi:hypothetical protein
MHALSAIDAISPAIQRTRTFLFQPFRMSTYLKLCLVACVTEASGGGFQASAPPVPHNGHQGFNLHSSWTLTPGWVATIVAGSVALIVLSCWLFYLITRLRFAYFHCLIHNTKEIRPGWHLYRAQASRFFWLNLLVGVVFLLVAGLIVLPFVAGFWNLFRDVPPGGQPSAGPLIFLILLLIPFIFLLVFAAIAVDLILRDLMLPHFALENATARRAWTAVRTRIRAEKGSFFVYALLRVVLPMAAFIAIVLVLIFPGILFFAAIAFAEIGIHAAFASAAGAIYAVGILLEVLIGAIAFFIVMLVGIGVSGPVGTAMRQYALLFYGGRYQPLGDLLWPPPGPGLGAQGLA